MLLEVVSVGCHPLTLNNRNGIRLRTQPWNLLLVFGTGLAISMHLDPGHHVIRVNIKSLSESSRSHILSKRKDRRARGLQLEPLTKSEIHCLPDYRADISKDPVLEIRV